MRGLLIIAKAEARRLQVEIDKGNDPRQQAIEKEAQDLENQNAKKKAEVELIKRDSIESTIMLEAWNDYIKERSASKKMECMNGEVDIKST
ncbi:MAG: hypothetical protein ACI9T7_003625 [Oleiphilaceae bacterium]